ncbi:pilus assembly protein HicB [Mesorhizobium sp. CN2-181]|uniref:pilus assembly protein HicB n=1 Tax=Mesorhizobium yinganensis TaxID=3157707 RepID=UPI0032B81608
MSKATYPLKLPLSIKEAAARLAKADGVSLNQWIASAVAQKVGAVETAADSLRRRAGSASADDFSDMLKKIPAGPVDTGDELPADWH